VVVLNTSAQGIYIGDASVTTANGFLLLTNQSVSLNLGANESIYGRGASSSPVASFIESGA